jgi:multiple sugar transport system permease protein/putative aldouronate transport system permease protein
VVARAGRIRNTGADRVFYAINTVLLTFLFLIVLYPLVFILSSSFSDAIEVLAGRVWLWPVKPSLDGYRAVFEYRDVWTGYGNTVIYTVAGTVVNVFMTLLIAYPLSRKDFVGRNIIMFLFTFTLFFNGGLIPTYILIRGLGMIDRRMVMIVPWAISVWNVIITRTYFQSNIPLELYDACRVDGVSNFRMLGAIVIPLSGPIVAVISLFYAVGHWNTFFTALIYLKSRELMPLQIILREILILFSPAIMDQMMANLTAEELDRLTRRQYLQSLLQYALIVVASAPVLAAYPFVQKYFVRGVMIGALKG